MLYTTYYVKVRMTRNLKSLANLLVNLSTCLPVNLKFRQRVSNISFEFRSLHPPPFARSKLYKGVLQYTLRRCYVGVGA